MVGDSVEGKVPWVSVDTVLIDMDGTLLNLQFDSFFWFEHVPKAYVKQFGGSFQEAQTLVQTYATEIAGSMSWYCLQHWSRQLGLDLVRLKEEVADKVEWLPGAEIFLEWLRLSGKGMYLVTDADPESLRIKMERIDLNPYFLGVVCSHQFGLPKQEPHFWNLLQRHVWFNPARTLFIDDSPKVLQAAEVSGIAHLVRCLPQGGLTSDSQLITSDRHVGSRWTQIQSLEELMTVE
jgi:putative hydrolase of the HAD superfamily